MAKRLEALSRGDSCRSILGIMKNLVISNGVAGLVSAQWLSSRGIEYTAYDAAKAPGEGDPAFAWRFRDDAGSVIASLFEDSDDWGAVGTTLNHKPKKDFVPFDGEIDEQFRPLLIGNYKIPRRAMAQILAPMTKSLIVNFHCNRFPLSLSIEEKTVSMNDGTVVPYEKLIWAAPLMKLKGILSPLWKTKLGKIGKVPGPTSFVGFEWATDVKPFSEDISVMVPFRFRDEKLKAYGFFNQKSVAPDTDHYVTNWVAIAPAKVAANAEDVAKFVKSLRREMLKELPEVDGHIKHEKILHYECFVPDRPIVLESLEVLPNVFYVGPEVTTDQEFVLNWGPEATALNLKSVFG